MFPRLPYNEFSNDMEYQPSMDSAWHNWLQPRWDKEREAWLEEELKKDKVKGAYGTER